MKFSYNSFPVLRMLEDEKLGTIGFYESDRILTEQKPLIDNMKENFHIFSPYFKKRISYITQPFCEAIGKSYQSLIRDEVWNNVGHEYGTILNLGHGHEQMSVMYYINGDPGSEYHTSVMYYFVKNIFLGYRINAPKQDHFSTVISSTLPDIYAEKFKWAFGRALTKEELIHEIDSLVYTNVIACINFIKYARVDTKILSENKKVREFNCNYKNETKSNVEILSSTWFTTLVKSDAFKVRGHFRLQPKKKDGEWTKELIWINDFEKHGYTAPARKLNQTNIRENAN